MKQVRPGSGCDARLSVCYSKNESASALGESDTSMSRVEAQSDLLGDVARTQSSRDHASSNSTNPIATRMPRLRWLRVAACLLCIHLTSLGYPLLVFEQAFGHPTSEIFVFLLRKCGDSRWILDAVVPKRLPGAGTFSPCPVSRSAHWH